MKEFMIAVRCVTALALIVIAVNTSSLARDLAPKPAAANEEILQVIDRVSIPAFNKFGYKPAFLARGKSGDLRLVPYDRGSMWDLTEMQPDYLLAQNAEGEIPTYQPIIPTGNSR